MYIYAGRQASVYAELTIDSLCKGAWFAIEERAQ